MHFKVMVLALLVMGIDHAGAQDRAKPSLLQQATDELKVRSSDTDPKPFNSQATATPATVQAVETSRASSKSVYGIQIHREEFDLVGRLEPEGFPAVDLSALPPANLYSVDVYRLLPSPQGKWIQAWGLNAEASYAGQAIATPALQQSGIAETRYHLFLYSVGASLQHWKSLPKNLFLAWNGNFGYGQLIQVSSSSFGNLLQWQLYLQSELATGWNFTPHLALQFSVVNRLPVEQAKDNSWQLDRNSVRIGLKGRWLL